MKTLLLILTLMTWTVKDKNTVSGDGQWPYDIEVSYANTYNKGQVRAGDTATLRLGHLEGIDLQQVTVYVKSNKSSGAGTFTVLVDGRNVATKSGSLEDWTGAYDNENYHPITLFSGLERGINELVITLAGTKNSLHIEKYEISYTTAAPYTVSLFKGDQLYVQLTESTRGAGVVLPTLPDHTPWRFIGWSETEIFETHDLPSLHFGNTTFVPSSDCTLWATYRYHEQQETRYMTTVESGTYLVVHQTNNTALCGVPAAGIMGIATIHTDDLNQHYWIDFTAPDTAFITHALTATPIGYAGTKLVASPSPWLVYHQGEETIFYMIQNGKTYVLWLDCMDGGGSAHYAGLLQANLGNSPLRLQYVPLEGDDPLITCHPESVQDIENVESREVTGERILMLFGNYELRLVNGRKELKIKN